MKKFILIKIALLFFLVFSCRNELEQYSSTEVQQEQVFKDTEGFQQVIDAAYANFRNDYYYWAYYSPYIVTEVLTDNLILNPDGDQTNEELYSWSLIAGETSAVTSLFGGAYNSISIVNFALKNIDKLPEENEKNNIIAQARALRGILHFDLARAYCKIPTQSADAAASMGIDYIDFYNPQGNAQGRTLSVAQVYDRIIEDLQYAVNNIDNASPESGRLNKPAVLGLLTRVYLYKGDYANVLKYGQQCIALSPSVGTIGNFPEIWSSNQTDGVLFKILNDNSDDIDTGSGYQTGARPDGGEITSEYVVPKSLYDLFTDDDIRKTSYMRQGDYNDEGVRNHVIKWAFNTGGDTLPNHVEIKYLRTAEVYLNVAEAAYKMGNPVLANQLLNTLKQNRYVGYVDVTLAGNALWDEIMLQRRLEMAFEADRYYTLKRQGLPMQRTGEGPDADGGGVASPVQRIEANDYRWLWPIPEYSVSKEPDRLPQNPGY